MIFSEIVLGEHQISTNPDCSNGNCNARVISRKVGKIIKHENYDPAKIKNDIALIRLDRPVPLYNENPKKSAAMPICLPWDENLSARYLQEGKGSFNNYVDRILPFFEPLPPPPLILSTELLNGP